MAIPAQNGKVTFKIDGQPADPESALAQVADTARAINLTPDQIQELKQSAYYLHVTFNDLRVWYDRLPPATRNAIAFSVSYNLGFEEG